MIMRRQEISAAFLGITVALILWLTILGRETQGGNILFYKPFHSISHLMKDIQRGGIKGNFLGNLILFVPVGVLVPLMTGWEKLWKTAAIGLGFSIFVETLQLITRKGVFDPDDLLLNTVGCVIGYGILRTIEKLFTKTDLNATGT